MGSAAIRGLQSDPQDGGFPARAAACMKHFVGYSAPANGKDRSPTLLGERSIRELFLPAFQAAVDAGVLSAMESYNEVDGVPLVSVVLPAATL